METPTTLPPVSASAERPTGVVHAAPSRVHSPSPSVCVAGDMERPTRVVRAELLRIAPPGPFVILSQGWPSMLIAALSLRLPVQGAFFPWKFHSLFKPTKLRLLAWHTFQAFDPSRLGNSILLLSGDISVVLQTLEALESSRVIMHVDITRRGLSNTQRSQRKGCTIA